LDRDQTAVNLDFLTLKFNCLEELKHQRGC